jgi:hypothetical protein
LVATTGDILWVEVRHVGKQSRITRVAQLMSAELRGRTCCHVWNYMLGWTGHTCVA